jgi:hypothetical protein
VQRLVAQQFSRRTGPARQPGLPDGPACSTWLEQEAPGGRAPAHPGGIARERRVDGKQLKLDLAGPSVHEGERLWEYAVFVTDLDYPLEAIGQLYRDRADAENAFDELKNQWGWGLHHAGHQPLPDRGARSCALVYNWWSWYCRAAHPAGGEAITSRPLLLAAVGKAASHANQTTLYLTPLHGRSDILQRLMG